QPYHAALDSQVRRQLEDRLLQNRLKALVATTALGMGYDKPNLGFVVHFQSPGSVVHYYQQVGRAGRALPTAFGILLSSPDDQEVVDYFIESAFPDDDHVRRILDALESTDHGYSIEDLEAVVNLSYGQIEKVLKILSVETPAPVTRRDRR